jgi:hypothetical protein
MGRPPIGKQAMSDAERQRRRRAKLRGGKPRTERLIADVTRLEAENVALRRRIAKLEAAGRSKRKVKR